MEEKKGFRVVVSPHPDDEIFCLSELKRGVDEVIYVTETEGGRDLEAINLARELMFRPIFCHGLKGLSVNITFLHDYSGTTLFIPKSVEGDHPMHRLVSWFVRQIAETRKIKIIEYHIDTNKITEEMKWYINKFYPSQKWLLDEEERI